jgi:hypothetical protein
MAEPSSFIKSARAIGVGDSAYRKSTTGTVKPCGSEDWFGLAASAFAMPSLLGATSQPAIPANVNPDLESLIQALPGSL